MNSGKPTCFNVEVAESTFLKIHYDAPDIMTNKDDPKYGPTYVSFFEKGTASALDMAAEQGGRTRDRKKRRNREQMKPVNHEIVENEGILKYKVSDDSVVNVCIRASLANRRNVMRFALRVEEVDEDEFARENQKEKLDDKKVDRELSFMESQLERIESMMHVMLKEADLSKERDAVYHMQTDAMHQATLFWPILHVGILLVTGFTQANHIVQFFKKRHII